MSSHSRWMRLRNHNLRYTLFGAKSRCVLDSTAMFRLINRYLLREVIPYVLIGVFILTAIIFAHQTSRFSELLVVYSRNGLPMEALGRIFGALVPWILVFTLPISLLIGILTGMGRLSGDSEIVALGASGVSRIQMLRPIGLLSLFTAAVMIYLTFNLLPISIHSLNDLKANQAVLFQGLKTQIKPRVFEESIPHRVLYIEDIDRAQNLWRNIFLVEMPDDQSDVKILTAQSGNLRQGERSDMPELYLERVLMHQVGEQSSEPGLTADSQKDEPERGSDKARKRGRNQAQQVYSVLRSREMTLGLEVSQEQEAENVGLKQDRRLVSEMRWSDLINYHPSSTEYRAWLAEVHKRWAFPVACLVFALLGIAFGISGVRTGRSFGLLLGLAITIIYYLLALTGEHSAVTNKLPVWLGIWLANMILTAIALTVILMQRRPGTDPLAPLRSIRAWFAKPKALEYESEAVVRFSRTEDQSSARRSSRWLSPAQLIDHIVLSDLWRYFIYILAGFSTLFIVITLFQLLDQITRNHIEWAVVINYLVFLLPMIVNYMTPPAALVTVMIAFGLLEKTSQIVALKASGQSIYRLAAPALLASLLLSTILFLNQDYVLPFTNRRQDNLYHLIRSGQEPAQTFYQTTHKWIFGGDTRIYNYSHFDPTSNVFARLTLLDLSKEPFGIKGRTFARRARWDAATESWLLEDGWERKFEGERVISFEPFEQRRIALPEHPDYFKKDAVESSMMTLNQLRKHIRDLSRSGFDVLDLRIALYAKFATPLTCLVMVLVGLPFAFSVGKRGALYGVTIGIVIGLLYWGLQGLFSQMGKYEMLPPLLAAWGPNLLFGAGGLYLFLTSRT